MHLQRDRASARARRGAALAFVAIVGGLFVQPTTAAGDRTRASALTTAPTPTLTMVASASASVWGSAVDFSVQLTAPTRSGLSVANRSIRIEAATAPTGNAFRPVGTVTTDRSGHGRFTGYTPPTNRWYRAVLDPTADLGSVTSAERRVTVRQLAQLRPNNGGRVETIRKGSEVEFVTTVRPTRDDIPRSHVVWQVWSRVNGHWVLFLTERSDPDASGRAYLIVEFNTGSWYIRSRAEPTQLNANSFWTPNVRYDVN